MSKSYEKLTEQVTKTMIDAITKRGRNKEELREVLGESFSDLSPGAVRKRVDRFLRRYLYFDLIELRGGKYCWKSGGFKGLDDGTMITHSCNLIPALRRIARIGSSRYNTVQQEAYVSWEDMKILLSCANSHLRSYPKIWNLLDDYRMADSKVMQIVELFDTKVMEKLKNKFNGEPIIAPHKEGKHRSYIGNNIPHLINYQILQNFSEQTELVGEKIYHGLNLIAKGPHLFNRVREFVNCETNDPDNIEVIRRTKEFFLSNSEIMKMIEHEIRILILRIDAGEPLHGGCEICVSDR